MMKTSKLLFAILAVMMAFSTNAKSVEGNPTPTHRPLVEEYTGTWCGWCIRGLAGMELLRNELGDDFIGVAYHNGDAMAVIPSSKYPNRVSGFPAEFIDRSYNVDPLYGYGNTSGGILTTVKQIAAMSAVADIDVTAEWTSEDRTSIAINLSSYFVNDESNANYAFEVILVADDLYGSGSTWNQYNYYSGDEDYAFDRYLAPYVKMPYLISGIHFNDVIVGTTGLITGSLPTTITAYELYEYDYTYAISSLPSPSLVQNKDNLRVIALVYNGKTKKVVNANKTLIKEFIPALLGDVDDDGVLGIGDIAALIDYLLDDTATINMTNAEVNGDGTINIADLTDIIDMILSHS